MRYLKTNLPLVFRYAYDFICILFWQNPPYPDVFRDYSWPCSPVVPSNVRYSIYNASDKAKVGTIIPVLSALYIYFNIFIMCYSFCNHVKLYMHYLNVLSIGCKYSINKEPKEKINKYTCIVRMFMQELKR